MVMGVPAQILPIDVSNLKKSVVEVINNKLKLLKPCGFGFTNFNNFQIRAWRFWHYANI